MDEPPTRPTRPAPSRPAGALARLFDVSVDFDLLESADLDWWRGKVLERLLVTFFVFVTVAVVPSLIAAVGVSAWGLVVLDVVVVAWFAVLWRMKGLANRLRTRLLLGSVYLLAAVLLGMAGSRGAGFVWMFGYVVLAAMLVGRTGLLRALAVAAVTLMVFSLLGHRAPLDNALDDWHLLWAVLGGNTLLLAATTAAALSGLVGGLGATLRRGEELRSDLQTERDALARANQELQEQIRRREESEAARARLREQLLQAEKMDALGRLSRGIAHDLNNLLQPILVHGEFIRDAPGATAGLRHDADQVLESAHQATQLVRRVLTFGQKLPPRLEVVDLKLLLTSAVSLARAGNAAGVDILVNGPHNPVLVRADPSQLHQVVMNLCSNALQAMKGTGGSLTVTCGLGTPVVAERPVRRVEAAGPALVDNAAVWLTITDSGPGMTAEVVDHVFEPFFTTRSDSGGTGLGLSIVHGLVMNLGGQLILSTGPQEGTTFAITLPRAQADDKPAVVNGPVLRPVNARQPRVLVVDDEPPLRRIASRVLRMSRVEVLLAGSGEEALELLLERGEAVDLVLTDRRMPFMTGEELAETLAHRLPGLPVVLMSGDGTERTADQLASLGVRRVLSKPFSSAELREVVEELVGRGETAVCAR